MKIKLNLAALLTIAIARSLSAQIDYQLKDFVTPDIHYRRLDANTSVFGSHNDLENSKTTNGSGVLYFDFYGYTNTDKYNGRQYGQAKVGLRLVNNENTSDNGDSYKNKNYNTTYSLQGTSENRFYLNDRYGSFLGLHGAIDYEYDFRRNESRTPEFSQTEQNSNYVYGQLYASYGIGRIEPVTYARLAYDTYNWLGKKKRLSSEPTSKHVDQLGAVMTEVANTRFFDSRFKRIFQLEQIDSTLRSSGKITQADMVYFAQVADIWGYANNFDRGSGDMWEIGAVGDVDYGDYYFKRIQNDSILDEDDVVYDNNLAVYGYVRYVNQKPLSVKWQRDYDVALYVGSGGHFVEIDNQDTDLNSNFRSTLKAGYQIGYYPNTRTYWTTRINGFFTYGENADNSDEGYGYAFDVYSNFYYWITPRFRFSMNVRLIYSDTYVADSFIPMIDDSAVYGSNTGYSGKGFSTSFGASLSYALF